MRDLRDVAIENQNLKWLIANLYMTESVALEIDETARQYMTDGMREFLDEAIFEGQFHDWQEMMVIA